MSADHAAWGRFVEAFRALIDARMALVRAPGAADLVRAGLDDPNERAAALAMIPYLDEAAQQAVFPDLLAVASYGHGLTDEAVALLVNLPLPRAWVLYSIARSVEPLLERSDYEEVRMMLRIYGELGAHDLARALAERAARHEDADVREAGEDYLSAHPPTA